MKPKKEMKRVKAPPAIITNTAAWNNTLPMMLVMWFWSIPIHIPTPSIPKAKTWNIRRQKS